MLDAAQQLVEIVERAVRVFQPPVVQHEALDDVFAQPLRGPDAELSGHAGFDPVTDGDDGVEAVEVDLSLYISRPLAANRQEFLVSCLWG